MFKKDSSVLVEGRLQVRSFEEKAGTRKWVTEIVASNVQFADGQVVPEQVAAPAAAVADEEVEELPEDDLPF
jgi:single-strand DNA-binding protein